MNQISPNPAIFTAHLPRSVADDAPILGVSAALQQFKDFTERPDLSSQSIDAAGDAMILLERRLAEMSTATPAGLLVKLRLAYEEFQGPDEANGPTDESLSGARLLWSAIKDAERMSEAAGAGEDALSGDGRAPSSPPDVNRISSSEDPVIAMARVLEDLDRRFNEADEAEANALSGAQEREAVELASAAVNAMRKSISYIPSSSLPGAVVQINLAHTAIDNARAYVDSGIQVKDDIEQAERHIEAGMAALIGLAEAAPLLGDYRPLLLKTAVPHTNQDGAIFTRIDDLKSAWQNAPTGSTKADEAALRAYLESNFNGPEEELRQIRPTNAAEALAKAEFYLWYGEEVGSDDPIERGLHIAIRDLKALANAEDQRPL